MVVSLENPSGVTHRREFILKKKTFSVISGSNKF